MGYLERPNLFERQQQEDEWQAALRRELERQVEIERLAEENRFRIEQIRTT